MTSIIKQLVECHLHLTKGVKPVIEFEGDTIVLRVNVCKSVLSNIVVSNRADQQVLTVFEQVVHKEYKQYQKVSNLETFKFPDYVKLGVHVYRGTTVNEFENHVGKTIKSIEPLDGQLVIKYTDGDEALVGICHGRVYMSLSRPIDGQPTDLHGM